jgi:hypothetical protein
VVVIMSEPMQKEIDAIVALMAPPPQSTGLLTARDVQDIVRRAASKGALVGWLAAEKDVHTRMSRSLSQLEYENQCNKDRVKELEMEIIGLQR